MYRKNTAGQFLVVQLLLTATGAVATGCAPAARRCIDGLFGAGGGTFTEDGSTGSFKYALAAADTNGNDISIIVTGTGAIPVVVNFVTTAADPTNATTFGITDIDAAISSRMATYAQPTGFLAATFPAGTIANQTNITGGIITSVSGAVGSVAARVTANTDQVAGNATAATNVSGAMQAICRGTCSGGTTTTAVVSSMTSPSSLTATGQLIGRTILFDSTTATGALQSQASNITNSTTGATPTITFAAMTTAPSNTDTFSIV